MIEELDFGKAWLKLLYKLRSQGEIVSPRAQSTLEIRDVSLRVFHPLKNLLDHPKRDLNFKFAVAEWLWIWFGDNKLSTIERYNSKYKEFSDDGLILAGAYGPRIRAQWQQTVAKLRNDHDTRQAVISIYSPNPGPSRDVPCTISFQFFIRDRFLHLTVNMRSSDIWLGLPYDMFTFSMIQNLMAMELEMDIGHITFHLGSSHLYEIHNAVAQEIINSPELLSTISSPQFDETVPMILKDFLAGEDIHAYAFEGIWAMYAEVLRSSRKQSGKILTAKEAVWNV